MVVIATKSLLPAAPHIISQVNVAHVHLYVYSNELTVSSFCESKLTPNNDFESRFFFFFFNCLCLCSEQHIVVLCPLSRVLFVLRTCIWCLSSGPF